MANSKLATWKWSKKTTHYNTREHKIDTITIHHMAGNSTLAACCAGVESRGGSCNYCIDSSGRIGVMVDEQYRSWCSSNRANDTRAVTIEVANDRPSDAGGWHVSSKAMSALINLCVDICRRNGITKLRYTGNTSGNMTMHRWFAATGCPGPYLAGKFPYIAKQVNAKLGSGTKTTTPNTKSYKVKVTYKGGLNVRKAAGIKNAKVKGVMAKYGTVYTIVADKVVDDQTWGKLKSGAGWICLTGFTRKI